MTNNRCLRHREHNKMSDILTTTFTNTFSWKNIVIFLFKCHWSLFLQWLRQIAAIWLWYTQYLLLLVTNYTTQAKKWTSFLIEKRKAGFVLIKIGLRIIWRHHYECYPSSNVEKTQYIFDVHAQVLDEDWYATNGTLKSCQNTCRTPSDICVIFDVIQLTDIQKRI